MFSETAQYETDVLVVGGGVSGAIAAISASRFVKDVVLLERSPLLGGTISLAHVGTVFTFHGQRGERIISGIPQTIVAEMCKIGASLGFDRDTLGVAYSLVWMNPDWFPYVLHKMLKHSDVNVFLHTPMVNADIEGGNITKVLALGEDGKTIEIKAKVYIDATGFASLSERVGATIVCDGGKMPATLMFRVGNVNLQRTIKYALKNPNQFHPTTLFSLMEDSKYVGFSGFFDLVKNKKLSVPRDRILMYKTEKDGEVSVNTSRILIKQGLYDNSFLQREGRRQVYEIFNFLKRYVDGFQKACVNSIAPCIGIRDAKRVLGEYILTEKDVTHSRRFQDEIAFGGFPIDIHSNKDASIRMEHIQGDGFYGIPYRCILPKGVKNLLITGKIISSTFSAWASARVMATVMALGEASGTAAGLSVLHRKYPKDLNPTVIRQNLQKYGAIIDPIKGVVDPL